MSYMHGALLQLLTIKLQKKEREKRQKRAAELKNSGPAKTPFEATKQMLTRKETLENPKKRCNVDDSINHNAVKSSNIYPEEDETYEDSFVQYDEGMHYNENVGGYDYDQYYDDMRKFPTATNTGSFLPICSRFGRQSYLVPVAGGR
ncbi:hypothetical protein P3S67_005686 [Capsicum chacoense]